MDKKFFGWNFWIKKLTWLISVNNFYPQIWITFLDKIYHTDFFGYLVFYFIWIWYTVPAIDMCGSANGSTILILDHSSIGHVSFQIWTSPVFQSLLYPKIQDCLKIGFFSNSFVFQCCECIFLDYFLYSLHAVFSMLLFL